MKDENVFDIEQGVAISLFIKTRKPKERRVFRADLFGPRLAKYEACARTTFSGIEWREVNPAAPFYLFETGDAILEAEYRRAASVVDIFPVNSVGIVTARDDLAIQFSRDEVMRVVRDFSGRKPEDAREHYNLSNDARDWRVAWAQRDLMESGIDAKLAKPVLYRPFDTRWTYYTGHSRGFHCYPRQDVMPHMLQENVGLLTVRQLADDNWIHAFAAQNITDDSLVSNRTKERGYLFPLYLCLPEDGTRRSKTDMFGGDDPFAGADKIENISAAFRAELARRYGAPKLTPEQVFGYVYAILHAPSYRARYGKFLRGDFPRIPLAERRADFEHLAALGWSLAQVHLMQTLPRSKLGKYRGKGDNSVEKPRYVEAEQALFINLTQSFAPIPPEVWNFQIGGYQVLDKYLKSRKGRILTLDEVSQVERIAAALEATIASMAEIDTAYRAAFPPVPKGA